MTRFLLPALAAFALFSPGAMAASNASIAKGVASGKITVAEVQELQSASSALRKAKLRAAADGRITWSERRKIRWLQARLEHKEQILATNRARR